MTRDELASVIVAAFRTAPTGSTWQTLAEHVADALIQRQTFRPVPDEVDIVAGAGQQLAVAAASLMREATNYGGCDVPELLRRAEHVQRQLNHWSNVAPRRA